MTLIESVRGATVQRQGQGGRFYVWQRDRYLSVTTIINGGIPKPVLVNWAKKFTAEYAVEHLPQLNALAKGTAADRQGAIDWLKNAAFRDRDAKANLGSIIHDIAEAHVIGRPYPKPTDEQQPYVDTFIGFLADFRPRFIAVEMPVFNRQYRYGGTLDSIFDIPIELVDIEKLQGLWGPTPDDRDYFRILTDWKTGASGPWPEVGLQNTAYRRAEFVGQPNDREAPMPEVDGAAVLKIRPEGYEFYPVRSDQVVFDAFLYAREVVRWAQEISKNVIGDQIVSEAALARALEQSLEATEAGEGPSPVVSETEGAGGQEKVVEDGLTPSSVIATEEPAPAPSTKPRKPRAKKATP
jgi:hypothetical protein